MRGVLFVLVVCLAVAGGVAADSGPGHMEPQKVKASCGTGSATVTWAAVKSSSVVGYNVFEKMASESTYTQANTALLTTTSFLVTGLQSATAYNFGVTAVYSDGVSSAMAGPATCATS